MSLIDSGKQRITTHQVWIGPAVEEKAHHFHVSPIGSIEESGYEGGLSQWVNGCTRINTLANRREIAASGG